MGGRSASSSSAPFRRGSTLDPIPFSRKVGGFVFGGANDRDVLLGFESPGGGPDTLPGATGKDGGGDLRMVSKTTFDAHVAKLRARPSRFRTAPVPNRGQSRLT